MTGSKARPWFAGFGGSGGSDAAAQENARKSAVDMIFVRRPDFSSSLSGEYYGYVNYERKPVRRAAKQIGIRLEMLDRQKEELCCGVPYVIPVTAAKPLAEAWLQAIDAISRRQWEDQMRAFGLAVVKLGLRLKLTHTMNHNYWPNAVVDRDVARR